MEKPINEVRLINMAEFASRVCLGPGSVTRTQDAALRDITNPHIKDNVNDYANRRAQLALDTFEARMKCRMEAAQRAMAGMNDPFSPESLLKSGRIAMVLDLFDDMIETRRGF